MDRKREIRVAVISRYGSQVEAAKAIGLSEPRLSRLINGHVQPKASEIKLLRDRLGVELAGVDTAPVESA